MMTVFGARAGTTKLARLRAARAAAAAAAAAGGKPAGAYEPSASRKQRLQMRKGTGRMIQTRPFVIRVNIPGIMKQKSSSDMDVSNGSGDDGRVPVSGVSIVELGDDSHVGAGSVSGSRGSNVNPFSVATGSADGPRPMFRPSAHILKTSPTGAETPSQSGDKSRSSIPGTPNAAEALAMMMHAEYPEGLPEEMQGVSHFGANSGDEPPLMDFEQDMDIGYDDYVMDDDEYAQPAAPRKRTTSGVQHKRLRAEMERRKSLALAGLQATDGGVRRSTRQRSKPLEYWRGETKVYQRVHNSLPTVAQIERRTANPVWPRKTPGGPSQPFRISRLRPAEILRDIGGELPEPSPLDRRGVKYGLMPPPPARSWAEKYGINPLTNRGSMTPGRVPVIQEEEVEALEEAMHQRGAEKKRKRGRPTKKEQEERRAAAEALYVAETVADIISNVVAANTEAPEEEDDIEEQQEDVAINDVADFEEATEDEEVVEAASEEEKLTTERQVVEDIEEEDQRVPDAPGTSDVDEDENAQVEDKEEKEEEDDDEAERQAEREADEAIAEAERELAAELAAEAAAEAEFNQESAEEAVVVEDVEEELNVEELEDVVELNTDFSRADTELTTAIETGEEVEAGVTSTIEQAPLSEVDINIVDDPMEVDEPIGGENDDDLASIVDKATEAPASARRRTRSRGASLASASII